MNKNKIEIKSDMLDGRMEVKTLTEEEETLKVMEEAEKMFGDALTFPIGPLDDATGELIERDYELKEALEKKALEDGKAIEKLKATIKKAQAEIKNYNSDRQDWIFRRGKFAAKEKQSGPVDYIR